MAIFSRGLTFFIDLLLFIGVWYYLMFHYEHYKDDLFKTIIRSVPGSILIYFGCYSLYSIGHGLFILNDCPEEYESLLKDI